MRNKMITSDELKEQNFILNSLSYHIAGLGLTIPEFKKLKWSKLFLKRLFQEAKKQNYSYPIVAPLRVEWELTQRCNLRCSFCYVSSLRKNATNYKEPALEEIKDILRQLKEINILAIYFTGGEPLLRKDIFQILDLARRNFLTSLETNGTLITPKIAKKLKHRIYSIYLSLDGLKETHDKIRGVKGSFERTVQAIEYLQNEGIKPIIITFTITKKNYKEFPALIKLLSKYKVKVAANDCIPSGRGTTMKSKYPLPNKEFWSFVENEKNLTQKYGVPIYTKQFGLEKFENRYAFTFCNAGSNYFNITAAGKVLPCSILRYVCGDIKKDSLKNIWNNSEAFLRIRNSQYQGNCKNCPQRKYCQGCLARAYVYTGDFMGGDFRCKKFINDAEK